LLRTVAAAKRLLRGRTVWHVNSTASGGGVAEMLRTMLAYERGAGVDVRWAVIEADARFFELTKLLHHRLHGRNGDSATLANGAGAHYAAVTQWNFRHLGGAVRPGDIVVLHDPQTAGLAPLLEQRGASVVWRCHVGHEGSNAATREAWRFLRPHLEHAQAYVFSRSAYAPPWLATRPVAIIPPAIDPRSPKNMPMSRAAGGHVLQHIGLVSGAQPHSGRELSFRNGRLIRVTRRASIVQSGPVPGSDTPIVVQVSRWDPLKDMAGVMKGFARAAARLGEAHLVLAGPDVRTVSDDPEGARVLDDCVARWRRLPAAVRSRVHLVSLPVEDVEENAVMVNALQRQARVLVQKSQREGFGLTVTEGLWKGRAVVASAVGGLKDQIVDGVHGLLLEDPTDAAEFGDALVRLVADRSLARRLGRNGRRRVASRFLWSRRLRQFAELFAALAQYPAAAC
jgi:trehalose synthase